MPGLPFGRTSSADAPSPRGTGLGTFEGVFTPSILTILGVIMYLRFGWVVGNAGLVGTFLIVTLSTAITYLTGLSISAIATDQRVRTGGAYYMISRSLGIEAGGAVGIPLYLAQALSVALYTVGFAESVARAFPGINEKLVGIITTIGVAMLALKSARFALRSQYFIMAAIGVSLLSLILGDPYEETSIVYWSDPSHSEVGFWAVFAVFFPAVTGIMAGVNMSGDLRNPGRAIPKGTLAAIGVGYLIYMGLPFLLALRVTPETLIEDSLIMRRISFWGDAILLGVWGATLSSAVGSILGAPRVLQALVRDGILPESFKALGVGSGEDDEPRNGTIFTLVVALLAVGLGNLDIIAPILTMFFLTTYGVLNITAGLERFLGNPSFRPRFRVHWIWSLLGAIGCVAVMFLINALATVAAIVIVFCIFVWLERREIESAWGDVRSGFWMVLTRSGLLRIKQGPDPKNWRPHLLVLSGSPRRRWHLIDLAASITHNRALLTVATVLPRNTITKDRMMAMETSISEYLMRRRVKSLVRVISADDPFTGAEHLVESYGLGALVPNTILLGDSEQAAIRVAYCNMIARFHEARRNVIIIRYDDEREFGKRRRIDIWWGGLKKNGGLMLILAYLLQTSRSWRQAQVRVNMVVPTPEAARAAQQNLNSIVRQSRTNAVANILVAGGRSFDTILHDTSHEADLVLLGIAEPGDQFVTYYEHLQKRTTGLPTTILVLAAENLAFAEVLFQQDMDEI